jgi:hypothetical protein
MAMNRRFLFDYLLFSLLRASQAQKKSFYFRKSHYLYVMGRRMKGERDGGGGNATVRFWERRERGRREMDFKLGMIRNGETDGIMTSSNRA